VLRLVRSGPSRKSKAVPARQVLPARSTKSVEGGETLRAFNKDESREVSLSSMRFSRNDGKPFTDDDILSVFPPREFLGLQFEHRSGEHAGRALWMFGNSDVDEPCWVLMAIMVSARAQKMARCTIVCRNESDMEWAVETWKSVVLCNDRAREVVTGERDSAVLVDCSTSLCTNSRSELLARCSFLAPARGF
jgi:hypothetical protein